MHHAPMLEGSEGAIRGGGRVVQLFIGLGSAFKRFWHLLVFLFRCTLVKKKVETTQNVSVSILYIMAMRMGMHMQCYKGCSLYIFFRMRGHRCTLGLQGFY